MIRNVVVGKLKPGVEPSAVRPGLDAIAALPVTGCADVHVGLDAGLRAGGWDFAITSDWADAEAYRVYDLDEEHNRVRRELFDPFCEQIARVQFEL
ncbi:Stress responsive A/B Barrel Domain [Geodermatophilus dictyosporus]|uniref:Stress responsive A/B Barrel Domain n=1 Tax=Geodermatophilus dictyosporus TaxID=1523247 RepID=A0A1I5SM16_9ACTN|nr:Dabb family protein [Geodermatophilus dictyosporus]SFP71701.1 Stress responsive A/B Barrel Domain [Geodermatophilus dictyosporus]